MRKILWHIDVELMGLTPLLPHKAAVIERKSRRAETDYSGEWQQSVYVAMDGSGRLVLPALNIEACLRDASKGRKLGKLPLMRLMATGVTVSEFESPLLIKGKPITLDDVAQNAWLFTCTAVVQRQRVNRTRACLPIGWQVRFGLDVSHALIKPELLREVLEDAGHEVGLCDWRPGAPKPGKFGQFEVTEFTVSAG